MKKETILYGIAVVIERLISFLTLPILTKKMSIAHYGVWSQITVTIGLLVPVALLGFQTTMINFFSGRRDDDAEKKSIFLFMLVLVVLNLALFTFASMVCSAPLSRLMFGSAEYAGFVPLLSYLLCTETIFQMQVGYLRSGRKIKLLSIYYVVKNVLRIGALALGVLVFELGLNSILVVLIVLQFLFVVVIHFSNIVRSFHAPLDMNIWRRRSRELLLFALPLVPLSIATWGNNFVDRYLILHFLDLRQVSIYSVSYSLAAVVGLFYSILGFTLYPRLAQLWGENEKSQVASYLRAGIGYYLFLLTPSIILLTVLSKPIINIFSTREYLTGWQVVFFLSSGIGLFGLYQLFLYITLLAKRSAMNLIVMTASVIVNVLCNLFLIPRFGINGAAIATFLSNGLLAIWTWSMSTHALPIELPWSDVRGIVFAGAVVLAFLLIVRTFITTFNIWSLAAVAFAAGMLYLVMDVLRKDSFLRRFGLPV